jgi:hypothetical protein
MYIYDSTRWIFLKMKNISDKIVEKIKTQILYSVPFVR